MNVEITEGFKDLLLANGPRMAEYGGVPNIAVVVVPIERCGAGGAGHHPHRYTSTSFKWSYCPGG